MIAPQGNVRLRETISNHLYAYKGISIDAESILITSGAQQALHLIVQCLLKPGDAVAIENPSYAYSLPLFKSAGLRPFLLKSSKNGINPDDIVELHKNIAFEWFLSIRISKIRPECKCL